MEAILEILKDNWLYILVAIVAIIIIIKMVQTIFKVAMVLIVLAVVLMLVFGYTPGEVAEIGKGAIGATENAYAQTVKPIIDKELENAEYTSHLDGTYVIKTNSIRIEGTKGDASSLKLFYKDKEINIPDLSALNDKINDFIEKQETN